MVDWKDPDQLYNTRRATFLGMHVFIGIYIWEFFNHLPYDWDLVRGRRKFGIVPVLYLGCRITTLATVAVLARILSVLTPTEIDCKAWVTAWIALMFVCLACTSGLLYMRLVGLLQSRSPITWFMGLSYAGAWGMILECIRRTEAIYIERLQICAPYYLHKFLPVKLYLFAFNFLCFVFMLGKLLQMHHSGSSLWRFLFEQGAVSGMLVVGSSLVGAVICIINVSDPVTNLTHVADVVVATFCITRMQRHLERFFRKELAGTPVDTSDLVSWRPRAQSDGAVNPQSTPSTPPAMLASRSGLHMQVDMSGTLGSELKPVDTASTTRVCAKTETRESEP